MATRNDDPFIFSQAFRSISDSELTRPFIYLKRIGIALSTIGITSYIIFSQVYDQDAYTGELLALWLKNIGLTGVGLGIVLFAVIASYAVGKNNGKSTVLGAMLHTMKRVFLLIYLPSVIVLAIIALIYFFINY